MISTNRHPRPRATRPDSPAPGLRYYYPLPADSGGVDVEADLVVYAGTPAGIAAAIQASRMGKRVALLVFGRRLGGMTSGGLGATDIGHERAIGGISGEFYRRVSKHYGKPRVWRFEAHVAEGIFSQMLEEAGVSIYFEQRSPTSHSATTASQRLRPKAATRSRPACSSTRPTRAT
ncbi:MAG: FAD-dependent oxidoreductase [Phycisphaerales bacterium]